MLSTYVLRWSPAFQDVLTAHCSTLSCPFCWPCDGALFLCRYSRKAPAVSNAPGCHKQKPGFPIHLFLVPYISRCQPFRPQGPPSPKLGDVTCPSIITSICKTFRSILLDLAFPPVGNPRFPTVYWTCPSGHLSNVHSTDPNKNTTSLSSVSTYPRIFPSIHKPQTFQVEGDFQNSFYHWGKENKAQIY